MCVSQNQSSLSTPVFFHRLYFGAKLKTSANFRDLVRFRQICATVYVWRNMELVVVVMVVVGWRT